MTPEQRMTSNTPQNSRTAVETALERLHQSTDEPQLTGQGTLAGLAATQGISQARERAHSEILNTQQHFIRSLANLPYGLKACR